MKYIRYYLLWIEDVLIGLYIGIKYWINPPDPWLKRKDQKGTKRLIIGLSIFSVILWIAVLGTFIAFAFLGGLLFDLLVVGMILLGFGLIKILEWQEIASLHRKQEAERLANPPEGEGMGTKREWTP